MRVDLFGFVCINVPHQVDMAYPLILAQDRLDAGYRFITVFHFTFVLKEGHSHTPPSTAGCQEISSINFVDGLIEPYLYVVLEQPVHEVVEADLKCSRL